MSSRSNVIHAAQSHLGGPLSSSKAQCHVVAKRSQCHVVLWDFGGRLPRAAPGARAGRPRLALRRCSKSAGSADVHVRPQAFSNARAERPGEGARRGSGEPPPENVRIPLVLWPCDLVGQALCLNATYFLRGAEDDGW